MRRLLSRLPAIPFRFKMFAVVTLTLAAQSATAQVAQLYSYAIKDKPSFEEGYRCHLIWHAAQKDQLVWYAWTIDSGPREGAFVDGTFGATFAQLDAHPDAKGDGADFVRDVSPFVPPSMSRLGRSG